MPDVYAVITEVESAVVEQIGEILELRAADDQQRAMREAYLSEIQFPPGARVLEVGCGPGSRRSGARLLAAGGGGCRRRSVARFPREGTRARRWLRKLSFVEGDARSLPFKDGSFGVVVFHTTLCHVPGPELALAEAFRVLRPGGWLAVFDGDYATTTCSCGDSDPVGAGNSVSPATKPVSAEGGQLRAHRKSSLVKASPI